MVIGTLEHAVEAMNLERMRAEFGGDVRTFVPATDPDWESPYSAEWSSLDADGWVHLGRGASRSTWLHIETGVAYKVWQNRPRCNIDEYNNFKTYQDWSEPRPDGSLRISKMYLHSNSVLACEYIDGTPANCKRIKKSPDFPGELCWDIHPWNVLETATGPVLIDYA